jgi:hypothetical protein
MQKLRGLLFASTVASLVCSGGAQALQLNVHMPTPHLNPQPLPPGQKLQTMDQASPTFYQKPNWSNGVVADKHKDW